MSRASRGADRSQRPVPPWQRGIESDQSAWKAGTHLGSYRLERLLGTGSFGEVWEAADRTVPDAPRRVAVKILSVYGVPGGLAALRHEAEVCADLNHPNIIEVLGVQSSDEAAWIVMEFVPGPTLQQTMRLLAHRGLRLPRAPLLDVGIGICRALGYAWAAAGRDGEPLHILHRNLRPAEVMLSEEGEVKVGGFSLARVAQDDRKTATGVIRGSPTYIPPERWRGSEMNTPVSDLYSLGVLLWELAVGGRFFPKIHVGEMFELLERRTPEEEAAVASVLFPELAPLLESLLQRDPTARPQTVREVRKELQRLRAEIDGEGSMEQFIWMLGALDAEADADQTEAGESLEMAWDQLVRSAEESQRGGPALELDPDTLARAFESPNAASMNTGFWDDRDWSREDWQDWMPSTWTRSVAALPAIDEPDAAGAGGDPPRPGRTGSAPAAKGSVGRAVLIGGLSLAVLALVVVFALVVLERFG